MKYFFAFFLVLLFIGCSSNNNGVKIEALSEAFIENIDNGFKPKDIAVEKEIYDLVNIPQNASYFTKKINTDVDISDIEKKYEKHYFKPWNMKKPYESLNSIKWPFYSYKVGSSYGENLQLLEQSFFDLMLKNSNFEKFATVNAKALTIRHSNIRLFPTLRPLLKDPTVAGEGFPFDYLQNSSICANKPIFISHYSKDKEWAYIFSSFASGWIKSNELVVLDEKYTDIWQKAEQISIIKEDTPIFSEDGDFLFKSKIGMMFALIKEDKSSFTVLTVSSYKNSKPLFLKSKISKDVAIKGKLSLNDENMAFIIDEISKTNYGWGGLYEQRDCSSMLRDMFAPFGVWLPRNSYQQSRVGRVVLLNNLSDDEKIALIKEQAVPFETLLYKKGHVVLYVGTHNDDIVVFHNTWGIKTKSKDKEGRVVVGKAIFSTLKFGKEQKEYNEEQEILKNLLTMNIITK